LPFGTSRRERVKNSGTTKLFLTIIPHYFVLLLSILRWYEANLSLSSHLLQARGKIFLEYSNASQWLCEIGYYFPGSTQARELLGRSRAYPDVGDHKKLPRLAEWHRHLSFTTLSGRHLDVSSIIKVNDLRATSLID
jgi:hypothetical protein